MIRFLLLLLIAGVGISALWVRPVTALSVALVTAYLYCAVYGLTLYSTRLTMRLFRRRKG